jgi:hypothetical protein
VQRAIPASKIEASRLERDKAQQGQTPVRASSAASSTAVALFLRGGNIPAGRFGGLPTNC